VHAVARTPDVYPDLCRVDISYTIFPNIALSISATTVITTPNGQFACNTMGSTLDPVNGIGTCQFSGSGCQNLFTFTSSLQSAVTVQVVVYDSGVPLSNTGTPVLINLHGILPVTTPQSSTTLMIASVPRSPRMSTDPFVVQVTANTNGNTLGSWAMRFEYNALAISYASCVVATGFSTPVVTVNAELGTLAITCSLIADGPLLQGNSIPLISISFTILPQATSGIVIHKATNVFMTNIGYDPIIENQAITFDDSYMTSNLGGAYLTMEKISSVVQLQTHAVPRHVVLKPNGDTISSSVTGTAIYSNFGAQNTLLTGAQLQCTTSSPGISTAGGCGSIVPTSSTPSTTEYPGPYCIPLPVCVYVNGARNNMLAAFVD
jgi:hypothetical protein